MLGHFKDDRKTVKQETVEEVRDICEVPCHSARLMLEPSTPRDLPVKSPVEDTGGGALVNGHMIIGKLGKTVGAEYSSGRDLRRCFVERPDDHWQAWYDCRRRVHL